MIAYQIGKVIKTERKKQELTQSDLALICGTGVRFIVNAENGKETCHVGKILTVLKALGLEITITSKYNQRII